MEQSFSLHNLHIIIKFLALHDDTRETKQTKQSSLKVK
jgi:hypothetical protein